MSKKKRTLDTTSRWPRARRSFRALGSPYFLAPLTILILVGLGFLYSYYDRYSQIIDAGLRGDIFVRTSGIYAAPMTLQQGAPTRLNDVVGHLQSVGYLERGGSQNEKRGFYQVRGATIEITPGSDTLIDGAKAFHNLRIAFGRGGNGIQNITDLDTREVVTQTEIEPELISTVTNKEREKRKIIDYKDLPQDLVDGIVAIEDRQFFEHPGINWRGILRALIRDYQAGELREGGSSITQQLVKNFFLKPDRTWKRKLSEAYMSLILEQRLSKEEIMAMYCNQIYLGQRGGFSINGFGQAARTYFGKDISNLALHESALLAGIIRSPNYYSPYSNEDRARERRNMVLEKMVEAGRLNRITADSAKKLPLGVGGKSLGVNASDAPYFIDYLIRQLERQYEGDEQSLRSLRIYSTIDLNLQRAAYQAVTQNMAEVEQLVARRKGNTAGLQAALVAMNSRTGEILAMVGGRDYSTSQLNRATEARRQPGSVFKPFVYAAALELGENGIGTAITPASIFMDQPQTFEYDGQTYDPGNFGDKYEMKPMSVRDALVNSKNVITVEIAQRIGFSQVQLFAEKAGLTNVPPYPSAALGVGEATPLQVAAAYTAFANEGVRVSPISLKRVTTKDGSTLFTSKRETREVMSRPLAFIMTSIMQDVLDRGTGTRVRQKGFTGTAAGKTGSSRDAWFAGYTPNLVCVVWIGFDNNADIGLTGGATAAPIWADFMIRAMQIRPELGGEFVMPEEGLTTYQIDPQTGAPAQGGAASRIEYFLQGTGPDGQPLPDSFSPDPDTAPISNEPDRPRPTPTPRTSPGEIVFTGSSADDFIPAPPRPRSTPVQPAQPSIWRRVARSLGFADPSPTPPDRTLAQVDTVNSFSGALEPTAQATLKKRTAEPKSTKATAPATRPRRVTDIKKLPKTPPKAVKAKAPPPKTKKPATQKVAQKKEPPPIAKPTPSATPTPRAAMQEGDFSLDVCDKSGLLPVKGLCNTVKRRFRLGKEPTNYCNPGYHR